MNNNGWERWLHIGGSIASLAALGYLLMHLPRKGKQTAVAGLSGLHGFDPAFRSRLTDEIVVTPGWHDATKIGSGTASDEDLAEWEDGFVDDETGKFYTRREAAKKLMPTAKAQTAAKKLRIDTEALESQDYAAGKKAGLFGLPAHGRIPVATVKRALKKLPKKTRACVGMTAERLREGMEIEREHKDITGGRVGQTAKIAAAHICERPDYYARIKRYVEG